MNWGAISFDWNRIRAFLAAAEEGSLSAAARALGVSQPTLSRQVSALEDELGVMLFERGPRKMMLTAPGLALLEHVRDMAEAANRVSRAASGQSREISGLVRITCTNAVATYHLAPFLAQMRKIAPELRLEIITTNDVQDLTAREADIAIRFGRPTQPDLIAKLIGETQGRFYATRAFLDKNGNPQTAKALSALDFIGFDRVDEAVSILNAHGLSITAENFRIFSASGTAVLEYARAGLGVCVNTAETAEIFPDLVDAAPFLPSIPVPIWLATHRELHTSSRIRLVFDELAPFLKQSMCG